MLVGSVTAVVSAVVGVFTVIRSQSFAGHALTDVATTGGSAAYYLGLAPLTGFIGGGLLGAGAMEVAGVQRVRSRDLATGIVLGAATGIAALFLYLDSTTSATTGATQQILFGSIFTVEPSTIPVTSGLGAVTVVGLAAIRRPLLLGSLSPDLATARGVRTRWVGLAFMVSMAVAVGLSSIAIGSILSTALLIGPAATALRLTRSPGILPRGGLRARRVDHPARDPARLRQQLLGPVQPGSPGQLLHRGDHVHRVPLLRDPRLPAFDDTPPA